MDYRHALHLATTSLRRAGIENPQLEARFLLQDLLAQPSIAYGDNLRLTPAQAQTLPQWLARRGAGEPLARLSGKRQFWGLDFSLNPATLEPRPDTETLVEAVLHLFPDRTAPLRFLDIGTGTGCIALALLHEYPHATAVATDYSVAALEAAAANARAHQLESRIAFCHTNWCDGVTGFFDAILSNPPYITTETLATLPAAVRLHDPVLALDGGADGLAAYAAITPLAAAQLNKAGWLLYEVGFDQSAAVAALLVQHGLEGLYTRKDLAGVVRVVGGKNLAAL